MVPIFLLHGEFGSTFFFPLDNLAKEGDTLPGILQLGGGSREEILKKKNEQGSQVHKMFIHEEGKDLTPTTLTIVRIISVGWVEVLKKNFEVQISCIL
jgi:hypothetical protein